jgi:hypothetical protein
MLAFHAAVDLSTVLIQSTCCDDFCLHNEVSFPRGHPRPDYGGETSRHQSLDTQSQEHRKPLSRLDKQEASVMASLMVQAKGLAWDLLSS